MISYLCLLLGEFALLLPPSVGFQQSDAGLGLAGMIGHFVIGHFEHIVAVSLRPGLHRLGGRAVGEEIPALSREG
jgi:hypothetical protein